MSKIGIDLGTTNTVVAIDRKALSGDDPVDRGALLPSVVAYLPNGGTLVGASARRRRLLDPKNTIYSAKRIIGRRFQSSDTEKFRNRYPFELVEAQGGGVGFVTRGGVVEPEKVASTILSTRLKQTGVAVEGASAVISVPSKFGPRERDATVDSARRTGLANVEIVDEPIATAWAYLEHPQMAGGRVAVYDLGGGTFDFAVVDCTTDEFKVVAHGGDLYLGGDDIDRAIADWVAGGVLRDHGWDLRTSANVAERLLMECERAKIRCAYTGEAVIALAQIDPSAPCAGARIVLEQSQIAALIQDMIQRTFVTCDEVMHRSKTKTQDISMVLLAGGSTQLGFVRDGIAAYFGREPRSDYDPMEVIALGASVVASRTF